MAKEEDTAKPTASEPRNVSAWPGGWYIYENGRVEGPLSAELAFGRQGETPDGKPRLVSRKGFSQWYPLKDLSEIFRMADALGRKAETTSLAAAAQMHAEVPAAAAAPASVSHDLPRAPRTKTEPRHEAQAGSPAPSHRVQQKTLEPVRLDTTVSRKAKSLVTPASGHEPVPAAPVSAATPLAAGTRADRRFSETQSAPSLLSGHDLRKNAAAGTRTRPVSARAQVMHEYFMQRGRMRLGKLRNPWISGFVGLPLSLGFFWVKWYADLAREVSWHTDNRHDAKLPPAILALVPVVHIYMTYVLARRIQEMEVQNKYRTVSPGLAAMFALLPPFALAYLQDAVNRHWFMHVRYALAKRRRESDAVPAA